MQIWTIHGTYIQYPGTIHYSSVTFNDGVCKITHTLQDFNLTFYPSESKVVLSMTTGAKLVDGKVLVRSGMNTIELAGQVQSFTEKTVDATCYSSDRSMVLSLGQYFQISANLIRSITEEDGAARRLILWVE